MILIINTDNIFKSLSHQSLREVDQKRQKERETEGCPKAIREVPIHERFWVNQSKHHNEGQVGDTHESCSKMREEGFLSLLAWCGGEKEGTYEGRYHEAG